MEKYKEEFWIAKDRDGTVHFSNIKMSKPSEQQPNNPRANDGIFVPIKNGYTDNGSMIFYIILNGQLPVPEDLTFENSPRKIKQLILE